MKVVCIDDSLNKNMPLEHRKLPNGFIKKNEIYTVIEHTTGVFGIKGYKLEEKPNILKYNNIDYGWSVDRFVPLDYYNAEFAVKEEIKENTK